MKLLHQSISHQMAMKYLSLLRFHVILRIILRLSQEPNADTIHNGCRSVCFALCLPLFHPFSGRHHYPMYTTIAHLRTILIALLWLIAANITPSNTHAQENTLRQICPGVGIQQRGAAYEAGGIIITTFDRNSMWVYDIDRNTRFPLPETRPCRSNCRLSHDARWLTYVNLEDASIGKMRLNGTERTRLVSYASVVEWWTDDTLLVWTPAHRAYLRSETEDLRTPLNVRAVTAIQPGGQWGLKLGQLEDDFTRSLVNLASRGLPGIAEQSIFLGFDVPFFNAASWSPSGEWFAYVDATTINDTLSGEIFAISPDTLVPVQWTNLRDMYGAVRINGRNNSELSWSPDGTRIAFWLTPLTGPDPTVDTNSATIHILDITTGDISVYCDFSTRDHTPNPPRIIWSPGGTHIAFSVNVPADDKGFLLLTMNTETGVFTEMSNGIFPIGGNTDLVAWGLPPG
ncbi:MAG: hypothetical protein D6737_02245 [Chloroflexi bacterium]|nr:MAG: hypothetical protein D6737_02245 [Chloroflexota bacterium]